MQRFMAGRRSGSHLLTTARPVEASLAAERGWMAAFFPPLLGAWLGATAVGVLESLHILGAAYGTRDYSGLVYAVLLYGTIGLGFGAGCGVLGATRARIWGEPAEGANAWTLSFLAAFCTIGGAVARFVLQRDWFAEAPIPRIVALAGIGAFVLFSVIFWLFARNALAKTFFAFLLGPAGSGGVWLGMLVFSLLFAVGNKLNNAAGADVAPRPVAPALADRPNILLVVVDTLRADALSVYGGPEGDSPHIAALADESMVFEQAFAQAPWTRPSVATLLSGVPPCAHQCYRKADVLPDGVVTVAEALRDHGYTTGALVDNIHLTESFNFHQGFDTFRFLRPEWPLRPGEAGFRLAAYGAVRVVLERYLSPGKKVERYYQDAQVVTDEAIGWLARHGDERWFLMVHYMDPHDPYFPHPADGTGYARVEHPHPDLAEAAAMRAAYQGEVRYWDAEFARLTGELHRRDLFDDSVIVITADHGEEFGEHGGFWHGNRLYDEALRVPLLLKAPEGAGRRPGRSRDVVRLMDVAPTLVEFAGAPRPESWRGTSLLREYELRSADERLALAEADFEGFELQAVRDAEWTLIRNERSPPGVRTRPSKEVFYRVDDPGERRDLALDSALGWARERLMTDLDRLHSASCAGGGPPQTEHHLSPAECEALRSLGYVDAVRCPTVP